ncbi:MAG: substrate-binding domain-containing protein [Pseudolysinimonas sp.]|uniref:sugar ABC transporter substrate-binding protein n=1 Tax=Pseudolysinimonas sp. TaxID=2680009 RepID=UPI003C74BB65
MKNRQYFAIAAAAAVLLATAACSNTGSDDPGDAADPSGGCDVGGAKVAVVPHFQSPFTNQFIVGAQAAADECNAELQAAGPQGIDTPAQIQQFNDLVSTGAEAIVVVAYPSDLWVKPIDEAVAAGTEVGTVDVASPESDQLIMAAPKQTDFGRALGEALAEQLGPDAEGLVVTGICFPGLDVLEQRLVGFNEVMAEKVPGVTIAPAIDTTFEPAKNFSAWERLMQENPDALAAVGICDGDAANLVKVREEADDAQWIIAVEGGLDPIALQGVADGEVAVLVDAQPFLQGYTAMRALLTKVAGGNVSTGWIDTGTGTVTTENVAEITAREESIADGYEDSLAYYGADIERIFADLSANVKPFTDYLAP